MSGHFLLGFPSPVWEYWLIGVMLWLVAGLYFGRKFNASTAEDDIDQQTIERPPEEEA